MNSVSLRDDSVMDWVEGPIIRKESLLFPQEMILKVQWWRLSPRSINLLSLNYQGLGNPQTVRVLSLLTKHKSPNVVFHMETKCNKKKMERIMLKLKLDYCLAVESIGISGSLALMWNETLTVKIISCSRWHISARISKVNQGNSWMFTRFYGHPDTSKRTCSWELLKPKRDIPWLCVGDFNEIICQSEKCGAVLRSYRQTEVFKDALKFCDLSDVQTRV